MAVSHLCLYPTVVQPRTRVRFPTGDYIPTNKNNTVGKTRRSKTAWTRELHQQVPRDFAHLLEASNKSICKVNIPHNFVVWVNVFRFRQIVSETFA